MRRMRPPLGRVTDCSQVTTIPQVTGTCWFNALLMTLLYSERTRQFFYNNLSSYEKFSNDANLTPVAYQKKLAKQKVTNMFLDILIRHYTKVRYKELPTPEYMLQVLHRADPKTFYFDPDKSEGHSGQKYLIQVMKYFKLNTKVLYCIYPNFKRKGPDGIYVHFDNIVTKPSQLSRFGNGKFDGNSDNHKLFYYGSKYLGRNSFKNLNGKTHMGTVHPVFPLDARSLVFEKDKLDLVLTGIARKAQRSCWANIDVIQVKIGEQNKDLKQTWDQRYTDGARIWDGKLQEEITLGDFTYKVDSMIMAEVSSRSDKGCGHEIAGVTCNGKRYMYSGYLQKPNKESGIRSPCSLIPFDWFNQEGDFCLNTPDCKLSGRTSNDGKADKRMCFNMHQSNRTYLYVKEQNDSKVKKICPTTKKVPVVKKGMKVPSTSNIFVPTNNTIKVPSTSNIFVPANKTIKVPSTSNIFVPANNTTKVPISTNPALSVLAVLLHSRRQKLKDLLKVPVVKKEKICPAGKMINPTTGRCIKVPVVKKEKICPDGKMINPKTGRCIKVPKY